MTSWYRVCIVPHSLFDRGRRKLSRTSRLEWVDDLHRTLQRQKENEYVHGGAIKIGKFMLNVKKYRIVAFIFEEYRSTGMATETNELLFFAIVWTLFHHHHWSSVVHGCRLSAIELFRSPLLPVSGTNYHVTSRLHRPCEFFCNYPKTHLFQPFLSRLPDFLYTACEVTRVTVGHFIRCCYLLCPIYGWQVTTLCVNCPLWANQLGQLSLPSLRGH